MSSKTNNRLESWKAIANYLGRSVRTVRRWEASEGLPVHRQMHRSQASIYAYAEELDAWRSRSEGAREPTVAPPINSQPGSIAVLPFRLLGPSEQDAYIADGFTDEVITHLSRIRHLRVISRTSSMALKGSNDDAQKVGKLLKVAFLLEGTVRIHQSRLRVAASLIDAEADEPLWGDRYEGTLDDIFEIQEEIARKIVDALRVELSPEEDRRLSIRMVPDVTAWQWMQQARQEAMRWRRDSIDRAIGLLKKGLDLQGDNAELLAALGRAYLQYREAGLDLTEGPLDQAEACVSKAFAVDPDSAASRQLRGWLHYARGHIAAAVADLNAAREADWNNPDTIGLLCNCYLISGRGMLARPLIETLLSIDPLMPVHQCLPGWADVLEGSFESAVKPYQAMFESDPGNPLGRLFYLWVLASNGQTDEALRVASKFPEAARATPPGRIVALYSAVLSGDEPGEIPDPSSEADIMGGAGDIFPRFIADACALAGRLDDAVGWLAVAVQQGFVNYPYLAKHNPHLASMREFPAFQDLLLDVRRRWETFDEALASSGQ